MSRVLLAAKAKHDIQRLSDFLLESQPAEAARTGELLLSGLSILPKPSLAMRM